MTVAHIKMDEAWAIYHPLAMSPLHGQANASFHFLNSFPKCGFVGASNSCFEWRF
jgi:hypothetical protein